jgi:hypothetical protein
MTFGQPALQAKDPVTPGAVTVQVKSVGTTVLASEIFVDEPLQIESVLFVIVKTGIGLTNVS